jgi:hypothetical protein
MSVLKPQTVLFAARVPTLVFGWTGPFVGWDLSAIHGGSFFPEPTGGFIWNALTASGRPRATGFRAPHRDAVRQSFDCSNTCASVYSTESSI